MKISSFCPVSLADPFVLIVYWHDSTETIPVAFAVIFLLCNETVQGKCVEKCFLESCIRKLNIS